MGDVQRTCHQSSFCKAQLGNRATFYSSCYTVRLQHKNSNQSEGRRAKETDFQHKKHKSYEAESSPWPLQFVIVEGSARNQTSIQDKQRGPCCLPLKQMLSLLLSPILSPGALTHTYTHLNRNQGSYIHICYNLKSYLKLSRYQKDSVVDFPLTHLLVENFFF